ncbi:MAG: hypothetical protein F4Y74_07710 [Gemmatimonadales bacterium]|nr:hypothetical protein [Gemmatimonadales bacterium]
MKTRGLANQVTMDAKRPFETDVQNALVVYESLSALTPHQASFERLWAYLSHCDCPQYVSWRWLQHRPEKQRDAVRKVLNHFFATGNRGIIRDNGVSRLWWLGKIAHDIASANPLEFLTILLHRQDVRSALIERPSVSMNRRVLQGIYTVMQEQWANGGGLFERDTFRSWMVALNRRGGVVLLDSLPVQTLKRLLREEAGRALSDRRQRGG